MGGAKNLARYDMWIQIMAPENNEIIVVPVRKKFLVKQEINKLTFRQEETKYGVFQFQ